MKRWIALGAVIGLVIALVFTLTMPSRAVRSVYIPAPHGRRVAVYGALQPYAPRGSASRPCSTHHGPPAMRCSDSSPGGWPRRRS